MRLAWLALFLLGCGDDGDSGVPHIDSLAPGMAAVSTQVDVLGRNFCGDAGGMDDGSCVELPMGVVTFGTARATVASWKDTRVQVMVPSAEAGVTTVVVTVNDVPSNEADFEILP